MKTAAPDKKKTNILWWLLTLVLLTAGIVANHILSNVAWALRLAGWIILICIVIALLLQTTQGKAVLNLARASRNELRKVTWPTRQEAVRTTMLVVALVLATAMILWTVDTFLLWLIGFLTV